MVLLRGFKTGIKKPSTSLLTKICQVAKQTVKDPTLDIKKFLLNYATTSDYKMRTCKGKTTLSIVNKKYKMLKIENGLTSSRIDKASIKHYNTHTLEASITFNTPIGKAPPLNIYLSNITGSYRFHHATCAGFRYP